MSETFADLGIPFPLFEAPVDDASGYIGTAACLLCGARGRHCFELGVGVQVVVGCKRCGAQNGLDASEDTVEPCRSCGAPVQFLLDSDEEAAVCYQCLRAGEAAIVKDTASGMVDWDEANEGTTAPKELLIELVRTPGYTTWQGEQWQYCCDRPMVYIGTWGQEDFEEHAPNGDGRAFFLDIVDEADGELWEDRQMDAAITVYVFRCLNCGNYKAHWDMD
jgi:uncharacterized protein CbrC (UPF0167 family)